VNIGDVNAPAREPAGASIAVVHDPPHAVEVALCCADARTRFNRPS